jgi:hypothetical protein
MKWLITVLLFVVCNVCEAASVMEEYKAAQAFLLTKPEEDRPYIKFLAYSEIPEPYKIEVSGAGVPSAFTLELKVAVSKVVPFWVHSLSAKNIIAQPIRVPNAPEMFWIDIRNYAWTTESWEKVSQADPYYREPWITYEMSEEEYTNYQLFRKLYGNFIIKAVWFIVHTSDTMKQQDLDQEPLYYELLYSSIGIPKTVEEFRAAWGIEKKDEEKAQKFNLIAGKLVDQGDSGVARHNRILARIRTLFGSFNETSDVKNNVGPRDFLENLEPNRLAHSARDATEIISHNPVGLQVYFLADKAGKRVEFADPAVAWDRSNREDIRVKTARSCVLCHAIGLNPAIDGMAKLLLGRDVELLTYDKDIQIEIEAFYTTDYGKLIQADNEIFAGAVKKINELQPQQNAYLFRKVVSWYEGYLDVEQCAREAGLELEEFKKNLEPTISGRLANLFKENGRISREVWDANKGGKFGEAMLLAYSIPETNKIIAELKVKIINKTDLMSGDKKLAELSAGAVYNILKESEGWYYIEDKGIKGWVYKDKVELVK